MTGDEPPPDPSRVAVALQYDTGEDAVPRVTAKGRGYEADRMVSLAQEHGVIVQGNPALALALSRVKLDEAVPEQMYKAVAAVISFVLAVKRKEGR